MKAKFRYSKPQPHYPDIVEIDINPDIFMSKENKTKSLNKNKNLKYTHKKINSACNQTSKIVEKKKLTFTLENNSKSNSNKKKPIQTPEINTKYKLKLERLNTNICSLKNKYADLLKENIDNNIRDNSFKLRFLKLKRDQQQKEMYKKKQEYIIVKNTKLREEQEKNQKIKEEFRENKKKELIKKQNVVKKLKNKEFNGYQNHKMKMMNEQTNKKKIKENEKDFIKKKLKEQEVKNSLEISKRKIMNIEKEQNKEKLLLENKVQNLKKIKKDLESKVKILFNINNKWNRDHYLTFKSSINDENVKNSS